MAGISILFLSLVGLAILGVAGYCVFYRVSINNSLQSDKPKKRVPPQNIIIIALVVLLAISVGFSVQRTVSDYATKNAEKEYFLYADDSRAVAFDAMFDSKELAEQNNYGLIVWRENGFEVCVLSGGHNGIMPDTIVRVRYIDELPMPAEGTYIDFNFAFKIRNAEKSNDNFTGWETTGEYSTKYIVGSQHGKFDVKIKAELRLTTDKTKPSAPFAEIQCEMSMERK
jgi:hypothetical protein